MNENLKETLETLGLNPSEQTIAQILDAVKRDKKAVFAENKTLKIKELIEHFLNIEDLTIKRRKRQFVKARHFFCFTIYYKTKVTFTELGEFLDCDHSTITHSIMTFRNIFEVDENYRNEYLRLLNVMELSGVSMDRVRFEVEKIKINNRFSHEMMKQLK